MPATAACYPTEKRRYYGFMAEVMTRALTEIVEKRRVKGDRIPKGVLNDFQAMIRSANNPRHRKGFHIPSHLDTGPRREHFVAYITFFNSAVGRKFLPEESLSWMPLRGYLDRGYSAVVNRWFRSVYPFCQRLDQTRRLTADEMKIARELLQFCQALRVHEDVRDPYEHIEED